MVQASFRHLLKYYLRIRYCRKLRRNIIMVLVLTIMISANIHYTSFSPFWRKNGDEYECVFFTRSNAVGFKSPEFPVKFLTYKSSYLRVTYSGLRRQIFVFYQNRPKASDRMEHAVRIHGTLALMIIHLCTQRRTASLTNCSNIS